MKYVLLVSLSLLALSAQMTLRLPLFLQPCFPLLLALTWGLAFSPGHAIAAGAINGLLVDVASAAPLGSHLLATLLPTLLTIPGIGGFLEKRLAEALVLVPIATVIYYVSLALAFAATGRIVDWSGDVIWIWIPGIVANVVWSFPMLWITGLLAERTTRFPSGGIALRPFTHDRS